MKKFKAERLNLKWTEVINYNEVKEKVEADESLKSLTSESGGTVGAHGFTVINWFYHHAHRKGIASDWTKKAHTVFR